MVVPFGTLQAMRLHDARLYAAVVGAAYFYWRRGVLGTMLAGMAVYLPLHLGLGW